MKERIFCYKIIHLGNFNGCQFQFSPRAIAGPRLFSKLKQEMRLGVGMVGKMTPVEDK